MQLYFLNQFYYPDIAATAQILTDLCEQLAAAGHKVSVLCSGARYRIPHRGAKVAPNAEQPLALDEVHAGVHIHRVPLSKPPSSSAHSPWVRLVSRALRELQFSLGGLVKLVRLPAAPDVLVVMSTPPTLLLLGQIGRFVHGTPLVYWVQDVYPDLLFALHALPTRGFISQAVSRGFGALWQKLSQRVDAAVVLDEAMRQRLLAQGFPAQRIHVVEHFADCAEIRPQPASENRLRQSLKLEEAFVVGYAGNLGRGHDFETVAAAMALLARPDADADAERIHFLFVGDGEKRAALREAVPERLSSRVHFLPPQARGELRDVLTVGDVGLITLLDGLEGLMVPSKLYALLAAGQPLLYVGPQAGRVGELVQTEPVGESVRNGDAAGLVQALLRLVRDPARRTRFAKRARQLAETRYDRRLICAQHEALLSRIAADHRRGKR